MNRESRRRWLRSRLVRDRRKQRGATVVFGVVGAAIGAMVDPANPVQGAQWGWAIGTVVGGLLFPPHMPATTLGKLDDLRVTSSTYGTFIPQTWGQFRGAGQVIWATDLVEHQSNVGGGGKGGGGGGGTTVYSYTSSFAVLVAPGPLKSIDRVWFNDQIVYDSLQSPTTQSGLNIEGMYTGTESQTADPLMSSVLSVSGEPCPAYRGWAYMVFQDVLLTNYGNRLPNIQIEYTAYGDTAADVLTDISLQCGLQPATYTVSGAGSGTANGTYSMSGRSTADNSLVYDNGSCAMKWDPATSHWRIIASHGAGSVLYTIAGVRAFPTLGAWTTSGGTNPAPSSAVATPADFDFTQAVDSSITGPGVYGYCNPIRQIGKAALDPLALIMNADVVEADGQIIWVPRGGAPSRTLTTDDLGALEWGADGGGMQDDTVLMHYKRQQSWELPTRVECNYFQWNATEAARNYLQATQVAIRSTQNTSQNVQSMTFPAVMDDSFARQLCERLLYTAWVEADSFTCAVGPRNADVIPSDVLMIPHGGQNKRVRVVQKDEAIMGISQLQLVADSLGVNSQFVAGSPTGGIGVPFYGAGSVNNIVFQMNAPNDAIAQSGHVNLYFGAVWQPGASGVGIYVSLDGGTSYTGVVTKNVYTLMGPCINTLGSWTNYGVMDTTNHLDVTFLRGQPSSCSSADLANGVNALWVNDEIIQFQTATLLSGQTWRLTNLLRGQRGTDNFMSTHGSSEFAVHVDSSLGAWGVTPSPWGGGPALGTVLYVKFVPIGQTLGSVSPLTITYNGMEWEPYSVTSVNGSRNMAGDLSIGWTPRSRWAGSTPSDPNNFDVEVWDSASYTTLVRTITVSGATSTTYLATDQTTDFGSAQSTVYLRIYQKNSYVGRGYVWQGSL